MFDLAGIVVLMAALVGAPGAAVANPAPHASAPALAPAAASAAAPLAERVAMPLRDDWLGADKFRHFWMSYATTAVAFAVVRAAGQDSGTSLRVAVPVSAAAGLGKEIYDRRAGGIFSYRDLVADGLGIAGAYFLLREVR
jgi:putative lipoprotein